MSSTEFEIHHSQKEFFRTGQTKSLQFRKQQLELLLSAIKKHEPAILKALAEDLGKPEYESYISEVGFLYDEIRHALKSLKTWMKPKCARTSLLVFPAKGRVYAEPLGTVLIVGPWNYPFQLLFSPLVGAMAAGNCAVLKPSELAPQTSAVVKKMVSEFFPPAYLAVQEGAVESSQRLLELAWDYIFFTGSTQVGRVVMAAAAKHLTPVTLELGGKSPCIVDADADLLVSSRRIAWGKFFNAGQTCVAPDYVLVHSKVKAEFLQHLKARVEEFFGISPRQSPDFARIVNERHFRRLLGYLERKKAWLGGDSVASERYLAPTILTDVSLTDSVMQEEIFGPILPVLEYESLEEAVKLVTSRPKPLAFYFFSKNRARQEQVLRDISFGGGCINDTLVHLTSPHLPFGGVGESGMGAYHGRASFDVFSHKKSVLKKPFFGDLSLRYPPYGKKLNLIRRFLK